MGIPIAATKGVSLLDNLDHCSFLAALSVRLWATDLSDTSFTISNRRTKSSGKEDAPLKAPQIPPTIDDMESASPPALVASMIAV